MNLVKIREMNFQPLVSWLTRQRTEVVLLVAQIALGAWGIFIALPSLMDRIEAHHTNQIREISRQFQSDQARDSKEKELLIQKAFGHVPNEDPNLAAKP